MVIRSTSEQHHLSPVDTLALNFSSYPLTQAIQLKGTVSGHHIVTNLILSILYVVKQEIVCPMAKLL